MKYDLNFTEIARFWSKVEVMGDTQCWEWRAYRKEAGYGQFTFERRMVGAHRIAYALLHGSIPDGLHIDHLCRNPPCVNPRHLEAVTLGENTRRGVATQRAAALKRAKTHCPQGHEYTPANTYFSKGKQRHCRACNNARSRLKRKRIEPSRVVFDGEGEEP